MSDRRRQIAALRAKADSTTFPAEAEACRAKADELAALEPAPKVQDGPVLAPGNFFYGQSIKFSFSPGDLFNAAGGVTVNFDSQPFTGDDSVRFRRAEPVEVTVTHPDGSTHTIRVQ
jgi:hypothetical protein